MVISTPLESPIAVVACPEEDRTALGCHRCSEDLAGLPRWAEHCRWHQRKKAGLQGAHQLLEVALFGRQAAPTSVHSFWTWMTEGPAWLAREGLTENSHLDKAPSTVKMVDHDITHKSQPERHFLPHHCGMWTFLGACGDWRLEGRLEGRLEKGGGVLVADRVSDHRAGLLFDLS